MKATEALRLIAARAPSISHEAAKTLLVKSPSQQRLSLIIMNALHDPEAAWTQQERAELVVLMAPPADAHTRMFTIRLTEDEYQTACERADDETGGNMAELFRRSLQCDICLQAMPDVRRRPDPADTITETIMRNFCNSCYEDRRLQED